MAEMHRWMSRITAVSFSVLLVACGGGGGDSISSTSGGNVQSVSDTNSTAPVVAQEQNAPQATGNTATDGFNWFNYRRQQIGLSAVTRNSLIDAAAQGHSNYQKINDTITHEQIPGKPGFTGATLPDRLQAAGYVFTERSYSYGEVISATADTSGFNAAEDLIGAIYHRFVIFEPMFREGGAGFATVSNGYTYFTTNFAANGLGPGVGPGGLVTYPAANQQRVPVIFFSDRETPDPMPNQNEVGYPVSIHADITSTVNVTSFTLRPRGGASLPVRLLTATTDAETPASAAAIIPYSALVSGTTYDVQFSGTIDNAPVNRTWSFTTR